MRSILLILISACICFSQEKKQDSVSVLGILELEANGIEKTEARALTERLQNLLIRNGAYDIIFIDSMEIRAICEKESLVGTGKFSAKVLKAVGKETKAPRIVTGSVAKMSSSFYVTLRMVDTESGKIIALSEHRFATSMMDVLGDGMRIMLNDLIEDMNPKQKRWTDGVFAGCLGFGSQEEKNSSGSASAGQPSSSAAFSGHISVDSRRTPYFSYLQRIGYFIHGGKKKIEVPDILNSGTISREIRSNLRYLTFSVSPKIEYPVFYVKPYAWAGPQGGFALFANRQTRNIIFGIPVPGTDSTLNIINEINRFDAGISGGAGISFGNGKFSPLVEISYYYGLLNVLKKPAGQEFLNNRSLNISIGFRLSGRKP